MIKSPVFSAVIVLAKIHFSPESEKDCPILNRSFALT